MTSPAAPQPASRRIHPRPQCDRALTRRRRRTTVIARADGLRDPYHDPSAQEPEVARSRARRDRGRSCVIDGALKSLEICKRAGVPVAYGSDLLGQLQVAQSREFSLRTRVLKPIEVIRQATTVGARVIRREGQLGCIKPGALADLLVVDDDPLKDISVLEHQGRHLAAIMKGGAFHKSRIGTSA